MMDAAALEARARELGAILHKIVPPGTGFLFALFDFGDQGTMSYISNARREDMIKGLAELREKLIEGRQ